MPDLPMHNGKSLYDASCERRVVLLDLENDGLPFDRIVCSDLISIGQAWVEMANEDGEPLPRWRSFSPANFKSVIDKLCVLTVEDWRADKLEFTLYGNHSTENIGLGKPLSMQEMRLDPVRRGNYEDIRDRAGRAIENNAPQYARKTLSWNDAGFIDYETLMLPFMPENGAQRILQSVSARIEIKG